jgi:hypothetical protein
MTLTIAFMYIMIDKTTNSAYCSACLGTLATIAGVEYSTLWRNMQANSKVNAIDNDIKYCKGKYIVYEAIHVKSKKGNNGKIREINQARAKVILK